jgi:putative tricarboxylic transport membrane protein
MDILHDLLVGFSVSLEPMHLFFCFVGVLIGTLIGILPGLGPSAAISLLLPSTYHLDPASAIIMLAGIYYGTMYGGSTTSILVNIPGEAASVVTCLDGYQMARQGRAGAALGMSAFGSFIAGTISVIGLAILAPPLARFALKFGPPEYFALIFCGLSILIYLARASILKGLMMALVGLFLGLVGIDLVTGEPRFTFGSNTLLDGVGMIPVVMGLFGVTEVLENLEKGISRDIFKTAINQLFPNREDWKRSTAPIARGTIIGFFLGILPGGGAVIASFTSYAIEKRISKNPEKFGKGAIEGVAGPEAANNAATGGAFVPLLTFSIPSNVVMALVLGALLIHGIQPGPLMIRQHPDLFWGIVTSMYIGNVMLLVLNLPMIPLWVKILKIPYPVLFPLILLFCLVGVYSLNNNYVEMIIMAVFGILGYVMKKFGYEAAPLVFSLVLCPILENAFRQSLMISYGDPTIFFTRPISLVFMATGTVLFVLPILTSFRVKMTERLAQEQG